MSRYITTTLPYVNADPHIGFALEIVQADAVARAWRISGEDVFFNTGADEHGQKILETAQKAGQEVEGYVDHYAKEVEKLRGALDLSTDAFIRTTSPAHIRAAEEMWRRCEKNGDIYKKSYTGMYCVGCELFKTEKEIADGKCILHPNLTLEEITEENYFFAFHKYETQLVEYLKRPGVIIPEWRRAEALAFVENGLEDFSISRERARLSWGVPVPDDDSQVMYVWFDALTSYLSTLGWPEDPEGKFKKYWEEGATLQMGGKDQVRFQSLMWQAMLMSAGVRNTDQVFYHGFINSGGQRMSKSLGNVISPYDLVKKYGTDAARYILLRHIHPVEDSDVTWERLDEWYTANLVNGLGNLVARVMKLAEDNNVVALEVVSSAKTGLQNNIEQALKKFEFNEAINYIWSEIQRIDKKVTAEEPFKVIKVDSAKGKTLMQFYINDLRDIATSLAAFMPKTSLLILKAIKENKKPDNLFPRLGV